MTEKTWIPPPVIYFMKAKEKGEIRVESAKTMGANRGIREERG